jgi:hypothetical protein
MDDFIDDSEHDSHFDELESRLDELSSRVDKLSASAASIARSSASAGYCVGAALATLLSWEANHAIVWAAIHGFLSWIYVVYFAVTRWAGVRVF